MDRHTQSQVFLIQLLTCTIMRPTSPECDDPIHLTNQKHSQNRQEVGAALITSQKKDY